MILLTHITISILSLIVAGVAFIKPTDARLKASYAFAAATFTSGVGLIISGSSLMHACLSGITFLSIVSTINSLTNRKLAYAKQHSNNVYK